jgi:hypothetical protein
MSKSAAVFHRLIECLDIGDGSDFLQPILHLTVIAQTLLQVGNDSLERRYSLFENGWILHALLPESNLNILQHISKTSTLQFEAFNRRTSGRAYPQLFS